MKSFGNICFVTAVMKDKMFKPESQNFLGQGLAKPQSRLNLGFENADMG